MLVIAIVLQKHGNTMFQLGHWVPVNEGGLSRGLCPLSFIKKSYFVNLFNLLFLLKLCLMNAYKGYISSMKNRKHKRIFTVRTRLWRNMNKSPLWNLSKCPWLGLLQRIHKKCFWNNMKCNYNGEKVSNVFHCQVCGKRFKGKPIFFGETLNLEIWQKTVRVSIHSQISGF